MRKLFMVLGSAALITASAVTFAQRDQMSYMIDRMTEKLELNTTQVEQIKTIMQEQKVKRDALHEETKTKMDAVLTEDQINKLEKMRNRHEKWRSEKFSGKHSRDRKNAQ